MSSNEIWLLIAMLISMGTVLAIGFYAWRQTQTTQNKKVYKITPDIHEGEKLEISITIKCVTNPGNAK